MLFNSQIQRKLHQIVLSAKNEDRENLYEFEVYQLLEAIGLEVPKFIYIKDETEITEELLQGFGRKIVLKIISADIAHKQKVGGVKIVDNLELMFIQYVVQRMRNEVLSFFPRDRQPDIYGFLLVEYLPHTQSIGYETLIGFKEDSAFGPVLTLSKGGDDAEFFALNYDPANLFLPPLELEEAERMVDTLKIKQKFIDIGRPEYLKRLAQAAYLLSRLAFQYSFIAPERPDFIFKALDINPFVFTKDNRFVAIDGFAQISFERGKQAIMPCVNEVNLDRFFHPRGIVIVGVSADANKYSLGREIAQLQHDLKRDDIYFVNVKGGTIQFDDKIYPLYHSLAEVPAAFDLVVYTAPAQYTLDFFKELGSSSTLAVILISGIPANIRYSEFEQELNQTVPKGVRVIGPNCMGVFYAPGESQPGLNTLFIEEKRLEIKYNDFSNTVLLTQSGALAVTEIDRLQHARAFKSIVSFGNKYDVKITDLIEYFNHEDDIDVISLYVEGFDPGEGRRFFELGCRLAKPLIVYKSGRTEAGARAAASHTASMSGSYDVFKATCQQAGLILAENIEDHYDYVKIFSLLAHRQPSGNRVAGVVNAGFESTVGADELKRLKQAKLSVDTLNKLHTINRHGLVDTSTAFLDITPMADDEMYADFVEAVLRDPNVDCVFVAVVPHTITLKTTPDTCNDPSGLANRLVQLGRKYPKPMVISVNAGRYYQDFISILEDNGLPVYTDIRSAIKSLDRFVTYHLSRN